MTKTTLLVGLVGMALLVGCADNSFLELEVCVPAKGAFPDTQRVTIAPRSIAPDKTPPWDIAWSIPDLPSFVLGDDPGVNRVSVESTKDTTNVAIKVLFCEEAQCQKQIADYKFLIEKPFKIGERSKATLNVADLAGSDTIITYKCAGGVCGPPGPDGKPKKVTCAGAPSQPDASLDAAEGADDASF